MNNMSIDHKEMNKYAWAYKTNAAFALAWTVPKVEVYAKKQKKSIAAVIREALEKILREPSKAAKMEAVERLLSHELPVDDREKMEKEILNPQNWSGKFLTPTLLHFSFNNTIVVWQIL